MKLFVTGIFLLMACQLSTIAFSQINVDFDTSKLYVPEGITKITEKVKQYSNERIVNAFVLSESYYRGGKLIAKNTYESNGKLDLQYKYQYLNCGLKSVIKTNPDGESDVIVFEKLFGNNCSAGRSIVFYPKGDTIFVSDFLYSSQRFQMVWYNNSKIDGKVIYEYDRNNKLVHLSRFGADTMQMVSEERYLYDSLNNLIRYEIRDYQDNSFVYYEAKFNKNQEVERRYFKNDIPSIIYLYKYDYYKRRIILKIIENNSIIQKQIFQMSKNGKQDNLLEDLEYTGIGEKKYFKYSNGLLNRITTYYGGKLAHIVEYTYKY